MYTRKSIALRDKDESQIVCNEAITKYFLLDSYTEFRRLIEDTESPCFYEFIGSDSPVKMFMDIEIYKSKHLDMFNDHKTLITSIVQSLRVGLADMSIETSVVVLESHNDTKRSYHVICNGVRNGKIVAFRNAKALKTWITSVFGDLVQQKIVDTAVYREGLFRTYLSSKQHEFRPLVASDISDSFDFLDTFVCHFHLTSPDTYEIVELETVTQPIEIVTEHDQQRVYAELDASDKSVISHFLRLHYAIRPTDIREFRVDTQLNCIIISLHEKFCYNVQREHRSNHQYIVIDTYSSKQKCHDTDCSNFKYTEIKLDKYPPDLSQIVLKCLRVNRIEQELIQKAKEDCKDYINENFDNIQDITFDKNELVFRGDATTESLMRVNGKCPQCNLEHQITGGGYCIRCRVCNSVFPRNQLIPVDARFKEIQSFWNNYTNLINHGTVNYNVTVNYNSVVDDTEQFDCDVNLEEDILKNTPITKLFNQILDGHKITKIGELLKRLEVDFRYANGNWYYFNGSIWKHDNETLEFRKKIVKITNMTHTIKSYYESRRGEHNAKLVKSVKGLANKFHRPGFQDEIVKGAKMYFHDESFLKNLNRKKHLVPFTNGVFDLLERKFRKTRKDDYVLLTTEYAYDERARNPGVYEFLEQILPNAGVRDFVLKKLSDCLNGDIPNTYFLMFIGDSGANGKSQLLNLAKACFGELGEKVEVTLLTRKRNNANEANSEKVKLMHKRFAFLSEPEDGEKINIGLLKELTGSEEIVARGLYQEPVSFVMEAKLFLACNELPEIKGEDTALWRRIRVVDFPSRFVDNPQRPGEYKIDRDIPSKIRENISWRQTFMNILIDYYHKDVPEPESVRITTNEYREVNNDFYNWLSENVVECPDSALRLKDVCETYLMKTKIVSRESTKYKKEIQRYIKEKYPHLKWEYQDTSINGDKFKGWAKLKLR
ncbi:hypothetical protein EB118_01935 [bacterium]|nr:hypothetical protein [bacterium]NDC94427.1 hypothetical protein [bacterium]NDD83009.1 hypothetical protein [bacterium]NDG28847.1 hypothetical protein [bacterium]